MVHKTSSGEKRKELIGRAKKLKRDALHISHIKEFSPEPRKIRLDEAKRLETEANRLKIQIRHEDLSVYKVPKIVYNKKQEKVTYWGWGASWREGSRVRNVYLGSCNRIDEDIAYKKAKRLKDQFLGIEENPTRPVVSPVKKVYQKIVLSPLIEPRKDDIGRGILE
jgi:hypothetical protein